MKKNLEVAILGAGFSGKRYLEVLDYIAQKECISMIVYLYDCNPKVLEKHSKQYHFKLIKNVVSSKMFPYVPRHVILAINEAKHFELIYRLIQQISSPLKILVEKPFVETWEQLQNLLIYPRFHLHEWHMSLVERFSPILSYAQDYISMLNTNSVKVEFFWGKDRSYDARPTMGVLSEVIHPLDLCSSLFKWIPQKLSSHFFQTNYSIDQNLIPASVDVYAEEPNKTLIGHSSFLWTERRRQISALFFYSDSERFLMDLQFDVKKWDCDQFNCYRLDLKKYKKSLVFQKIFKTTCFPSPLKQIYKVYLMVTDFLFHSQSSNYLPNLKEIVQNQKLLNLCLKNAYFFNLDSSKR